MVGALGFELEPFRRRSPQQRGGESRRAKSRAQRGTSRMVGTIGFELEPFRRTSRMVGAIGFEPMTSTV